MQSKGRDTAEQQNYTLMYIPVTFFLCSTVIKRMIVMTTANPYCPTCTSLHAPRLPTQRLTSQLCMHDEPCLSTESTPKRHVMLRRVHTKEHNDWAHRSVYINTQITTLFSVVLEKSENLTVPQTLTKVMDFSGITYQSVNKRGAIHWP